MKKLTSLLLTLALLLALALPALAVDLSANHWSAGFDDLLDEEYLYDGDEDTIDTAEYWRGYDETYDAAYQKGYAAGVSDGKALRPTEPPSAEVSGGFTYADGKIEGTNEGYDMGYEEGYLSVTGRYYDVDLTILSKGGTPGQVNVMCSGTMVTFPDTQPAIVNGRTMVPIRGVMENLGAAVDYEKASKTVTLTRGGTTVTLTIGSDRAVVTEEGAGERVSVLDSPAYLSGGRTMVPLRFLSETFGDTVLWDSTYRTAVVLDTDALAADIDSRFTHLNQMLRAQEEKQTLPQRTTTTLSAALTLYDQEGTATQYPLSVQADTYTDGKALRMDLTLDGETILKTVAQSGLSTGLGDLDPDWVTLLSTDLKQLPGTLLVTEEGVCYLQLPILHALQQEIPADAWFRLYDGSALTNALGADRSIGTFLTDYAVRSGENLGAIYCCDNLTAASGMAQLLLGDDQAKATGSGYTWRVTQDDALLLGSGMDLSATLTMTTSGETDLQGKLFADFLGDGSLVLDGTLDLTGDTTQSTLRLGLSLTDAFSLTLEGKSQVEPSTGAAPSLTLPQGAAVIEIQDLF